MVMIRRQYLMKEFFIEDDHIRLHAKLEQPVQSGKCPLLILFHGLTGHMEEAHIRAVSKTACDIGFAVLKVDLYGHGMSEGKFEDHTIFKWFGNAMTVIEYAQSLDFVSDLYISGHSQGGLLAMMAAGARPDDFKALIPLSPAILIPECARKGDLLGMFRFDPDHIPELFEAGGLRLKGNYFRTAQLIHAEDFIDKYQKPVLIVHGDQDEAVPLQYSVDATARYQNCRLAVIPGDDHDYHFHLDVVTEEIRRFLLEQNG